MNIRDKVLLVEDERTIRSFMQAILTANGEFGRHLRNSIDWEKECFYQNNRRCAFLNEESLCDLYKALGPDALCDTCKSYPRHTEEYEGLRELSLSLSCPEAAKIILSCKEPAVAERK